MQERVIPIQFKGFIVVRLPNVNPLQDPVVLKIAKNHNKTPAQILLRQIVQRGIVVIPKSSNPGRQKENFQVLDFELTEEEMYEMSLLDRGKKFSLNFNATAANSVTKGGDAKDVKHTHIQFLGDEASRGQRSVSRHFWLSEWGPRRVGVTGETKYFDDPSSAVALSRRRGECPAIYGPFSVDKTRRVTVGSRCPAISGPLSATRRGESGWWVGRTIDDPSLAAALSRCYTGKASCGLRLVSRHFRTFLGDETRRVWGEGEAGRTTRRQQWPYPGVKRERQVAFGGRGPAFSNRIEMREGELRLRRDERAVATLFSIAIRPKTQRIHRSSGGGSVNHGDEACRGGRGGVPLASSSLSEPKVRILGGCDAKVLEESRGPKSSTQCDLYQMVNLVGRISHRVTPREPPVDTPVSGSSVDTRTSSLSGLALILVTRRLRSSLGGKEETRIVGLAGWLPTDFRPSERIDENRRYKLVWWTGLKRKTARRQQRPFLGDETRRVVVYSQWPFISGSFSATRRGESG
uniref:NADP-dependent oxidoreductase domain-containing protein n=1 Tax=Timema cristinae TaxID=61476 RepID=A0A7R9D8U6_TIMCR|nr:unnamed protein product [Timema cristinae]